MMNHVQTVLNKVTRLQSYKVAVCYCEPPVCDGDSVLKIEL